MEVNKEIVENINSFFEAIGKDESQFSEEQAKSLLENKGLDPLQMDFVSKFKLIYDLMDRQQIVIDDSELEVKVEIKKALKKGDEEINSLTLKQLTIGDIEKINTSSSSKGGVMAQSILMICRSSGLPRDVVQEIGTVDWNRVFTAYSFFFN